MEPLTNIGPPSGPSRTDRDTPASEAQRRYDEARRASDAIEERIARQSQAMIDAMPAGPEKRLVIAVDELLSSNLGNGDGYLGSIGLPTTRKLQRALAEYGITPDYGQSIGNGRRTHSRS